MSTPVIVIPGKKYSLSGYFKKNIGWDQSGSEFRIKMDVIDSFDTSSTKSYIYLGKNDNPFEDASIGKYIYISKAIEIPDNYRNPVMHIEIQRTSDSGKNAFFSIDDWILQLEDGHAGATLRRCNFNLDFQNKSISLIGDSQDTSIINCGFSNNDNVWPNEPHRGLIFVSGETRDTVVEQLTVSGCASSKTSPSPHTTEEPDVLRNAGLKVTSSEASDGIGGGIIIRSSAPTLKNIHLLDNKAGKGGGVSIVGSKLFDESIRNQRRGLFKDVSATKNHALLAGGVIHSYQTCGLEWIGGNIMDSHAEYGGSFAVIDYTMFCNGGLSKYQQLNFTMNVVPERTEEHQGDGAPPLPRLDWKMGDGVFWFPDVSNKPNYVEISDCTFHRNNQGNIARDIFVSFNHRDSSIVMINNMHVADDALSSIPAVVVVFNSCDEGKILYFG